MRWEQEPGSAGKRESYRMTKRLAGIDARGVTSQKDKLVRAKPLAAQAEAGNVYLLEGTWNELFLMHMHGQPELPHDDIMDAASGAFCDLTEDQAPQYMESIWERNLGVTDDD
ncbi:MAG: phage terminase large subunit [Anaerolineaceae bacterium]